PGGSETGRRDGRRHRGQLAGGHGDEDPAGRVRHGEREEDAVMPGHGAHEPVRGPRVGPGEDDEVRAPGGGERLTAELEDDRDGADLPDDPALVLRDPDRRRVLAQRGVALVLPAPALRAPVLRELGERLAVEAPERIPVRRPRAAYGDRHPGLLGRGDARGRRARPIGHARRATAASCTLGGCPASWRVPEPPRGPGPGGTLSTA